MQKDSAVNNNQFYHLIEFAKSNSRERTFELILKFFGQNFNLMTPIENDSLKRNVLQLCLIYLEEELFMFIVLFIVQNRDFIKKYVQPHSFLVGFLISLHYKSIYTIDYQDAKGFTALHYSAIYNRLESTKLLLKAGADLAIVNDYNQTAQELAQEYSNFELAAQIKLQSEGKSVDSNKWFEPTVDQEYFSESCDEGKPDSNDNSYRVDRSRPSSLIESNQSFLKSIIKKFRIKIIFLFF